MISLIIKVHNLEEEQRRLATFDYLTGVMRRRAFLESSAIMLQQCKRDGRRFSVAVIDIDDFKSINDEYGHGGGDEVLRSFSSLMRRVLRASDAVGRIGGEEFAVAMFGAAVDDSVFALEKLRVSAEGDKVRYMGREIRYKVSIGVAGFDAEEARGMEDIMRQADEALYRAKSSGKNRIEKSGRSELDTAVPRERAG